VFGVQGGGLVTAQLAVAVLLGVLFQGSAAASELSTPEQVLRFLINANAQRDLAAMSSHMAHDPDVIGYTIGGRKYVGWNAFEADLEEEFRSVDRIEIPIRELHVWTRGDTAWFAMEIDYIRHQKSQSRPVTLPLRETGVLERRGDRWILVAWHESARVETIADGLTTDAGFDRHRTAGSAAHGVDLSGEWEIHEEDKSYKATLDASGNGPYTHQGGTITTTTFDDRKWQGTWRQTGNDREGGFDLLLSEDGSEARGVWWYTRVGDRSNIPPRQWGGTYHWKRLTPVPGSLK
jgi:hypothetical protein